MTKRAPTPLLAWALAIATTLLAAGTAWATTIIPVPFEEMVRSSGRIVRVTVVDMRTEVVGPRHGTQSAPRRKVGIPPARLVEGAQPFDPSRAEAIPVGVGSGAKVFTLLTLRVDETIKGTPSTQFLRLRMPGGSLGDGRVMEIVGLPRFEIGKRYYLFLRPDCETVGNFIVGVDQGFFRIERDPSTGKELLVDSNDALIAGVEGNVVVRAVGPRRHAPKLNPAGLTQLVRSIPRWDENPAPPPPIGRP